MNDMRDDFLSSVQDFIANAFSIAIVRRMGPKGTLGCIRRFLKEEIDFAAIAQSQPSYYAQTLDDLTEKLRQAMPKGARHWGVARKCLNLFFRDALYNFYLRQEYDLARLEKYLEIPLDSYVGRALRREQEGSHLPQWRTVIGLTKEESAKFQVVAMEVAKRHRTERVHLDMVYWRREEKSP
jgi:hypothetical protein